MTEWGCGHMMSAHQNEWPQEQVTGRRSALVQRTALVQPGAGHHLRCGWSCTKLFVMRNWYFLRT